MKKPVRRRPYPGTAVTRPQLGQQYIRDPVRHPARARPNQTLDVCSYITVGHHLSWAAWSIRFRTKGELARALRAVARKVEHARDWRPRDARAHRKGRR